MPIITFPKGPNTEQEEETKIQEGEINYFFCPNCNSSAFFLYDDGEVECANPRCGVMPNLLVVDLGEDTDNDA